MCRELLRRLQLLEALPGSQEHLPRIFFSCMMEELALMRCIDWASGGASSSSNTSSYFSVVGLSAAILRSIEVEIRCQWQGKVAGRDSRFKAMTDDGGVSWLRGQFVGSFSLLVSQQAPARASAKRTASSCFGELTEGMSVLMTAIGTLPSGVVMISQRKDVAEDTGSRRGINGDGAETGHGERTTE